MKKTDLLARISIDPNIAAIREIANIAVRDPQRRAKFAEICKSPQVVRVEGMPRNCRIAKVLIDADYRMKMVAQGSVILPISAPFAGTTNTPFSFMRSARSCASSQNTVTKKPPS